MTADGTASFSVPNSTGGNPIRWLVLGGVFLIAAITIGTTIIAGNFRERALSSSERELENTVLLLARHFDQQLEDFEVIQKDLIAYMRSSGITTREDYKAAEDLLLKVRPYIRSFDSAEYLNGLANREICIAMSWSSDYALSRARARAVGVNVNLAFTIPKEGTNQNFTSLLIPEGAPHPDAAYKFIDFILRPQVIAEITNEIYYGNDNIASRSLIKPYILSDPTLYPTPEIEARLYRASEASAATERIRTRTWTRVKTAK